MAKRFHTSSQILNHVGLDMLFVQICLWLFCTNLYMVVLYSFVYGCFVQFCLWLLLGGEEKTIQFMESMSVTDSSTPLLKDAYAYGVVEHPFPLNFVLRGWYLGPDFYQSVKIGIVQYVC